MNDEDETAAELARENHHEKVAAYLDGQRGGAPSGEHAKSDAGGATDSDRDDDALDACLWTRMDFDGVVPIVGAHNFCGGDIVGVSNYVCFGIITW